MEKNHYYNGLDLSRFPYLIIHEFLNMKDIIDISLNLSRKIRKNVFNYLEFLKIYFSVWSELKKNITANKWCLSKSFSCFINNIKFLISNPDNNLSKDSIRKTIYLLFFKLCKFYSKKNNFSCLINDWHINKIKQETQIDLISDSLFGNFQGKNFFDRKNEYGICLFIDSYEFLNDLSEFYSIRDISNSICVNLSISQDSLYLTDKKKVLFFINSIKENNILGFFMLNMIDTDMSLYTQILKLTGEIKSKRTIIMRFSLSNYKIKIFDSFLKSKINLKINNILNDRKEYDPCDLLESTLNTYSFKNLFEIDLSNCFLNRKILEKLMCLLVRSTKLKSLGLMNNEIDDYDLLIICNYIQKLEKMEFLNLNSNKITDESCFVLAESLTFKKIDSFTLIIKDNLLSLDGIKKIKQIFKNKKNITYKV
jgi:hypothetical protein